MAPERYPQEKDVREKTGGEEKNYDFTCYQNK